MSQADFTSRRIEALLEHLAALGADAFLSFSPANRRYLTDFSGSFGYVLLTTTGERLFYTDSRYTEQAAGEAPRYQVKQLPGKALWPPLREDLARLGIRALAVEGEHVSHSWFETARREMPEVEFKATEQLVETLRMVKDERELRALEQAQQVTDEVFAQLLTLIRPGMSEREVATELLHRTMRQGAENLPGLPIVASGRRSALPHGRASDKVIEAGDFLTLDFGALVDGYRSDMTRTLVVGRADERQREIYALVLEAERRGIAAAVAGRSGKEVDAAARAFIQESPYGEYCFQYGLGHGIGLEIHERPLLSPVCPDTLEPGMVTTIEPGIYISGYGGVRIEDTVVVTESGNRTLSKVSTELVEL